MIIIFEIALTLLLGSLSYLFWRENRSREKNEQEFSRQLEQDSKQNLAEAKQLIDEAGKEAEKLLKEAKQEELKSASATKFITKLFEDTYRKALDAATKTSQDELLSQMNSATKQYEAHLKSLESQTQETQEKINTFVQTSVESLVTRFESNLKIIQDRAISSQEDAEASMKSRVNDLLLKFEQNLAEFLSNSQQKSLEAVNLEVKSAKELIETYKQEQLRLLDENIVSILEKTINIAMRKKLTLKDQADLVFESLEKAKAEKFLV